MACKRFLLIGYYGFGNDGDAWLLHKSVQILREKDPDSAICALYNPAKILRKKIAPFESSSILKEITFVNRWNPWAILKTILSADAVVCGGGGLLQDRSSKRSLAYYTGILILARALGKKRYLMGMGIGPLTHKLSKRLVAWAVNGAKVSVRDTESHALLAEICPKTSSIVATDLAYYKAVLQPDPKARQKAPLIGLSLAPLNATRLAALSEGLSRMPQDFLFVMGDPWQDEILSWKCDVLQAKIVDRMAVLSQKTGETRRTPLDRHTLKWAVVMRYHVGVWASLRNIPFLAVCEDPKLAALAESLGQPILDLSKPVEELADAIHQATLDLIENYSLYQAKLTEKTPQLIAQSAGLALSPTTKTLEQ